MSVDLEGLIDGRTVRVPKETTILAAARLAGSSIPTLCHHEGLPEDGNCRLCLVDLGGRLVISCSYPLREQGFKIHTNTTVVRQARAFVLQLLVNRCPVSPRLLSLACDYGVKPQKRFRGDEDLCIRCGRCVRACEQNGTSAISLVGRGRNRRVSGPFYEAPEACLGCLSCAEVCPTGKIVYQESHGQRIIWGRRFDLETCPNCGRPYATIEQLNWAARQTALPLNLCEKCRRVFLAKSMRLALKTL